MWTVFKFQTRLTEDGCHCLVFIPFLRNPRFGFGFAAPRWTLPPSPCLLRSESLARSPSVRARILGSYFLLVVLILGEAPLGHGPTSYVLWFPASRWFSRRVTALVQPHYLLSWRPGCYEISRLFRIRGMRRWMGLAI